MHVSRFLSTIVFLLTLGLAPAMAQDDDKGFLTNAIQNALSGSGRTVSIDGFRGALSSQASFCLLYTSPSPRDRQKSRMPSSA